MTYTDLERRVTDLRQQANLEQAISEINQFLIEGHSREELDQADKLLRMLESEQKREAAPSPAVAHDTFATALAIVQDEVELGEFEAAFTGLEKLLREQPNHPQAQALLQEIARHDSRMQNKARALLSELGLDGNILNRGPQTPPVTPVTTAEPAPESNGSAPPAVRDDLFATYQEAMRLYRSRYHEQAIAMFEEILHRADPDSQLHRDASEYRQKAEERFAAGEVPLDTIPYEALDDQSRATSAIRLGDYASAMRLLEKAIQICRQMKVRYPPEWNTQFQSVRDIFMALEVKEKGDMALKEGDLDKAIQHWGNAQNVLQDPDLDQRLKELKEARQAVIDGDIINQVLMGQPSEYQTKQLIDILQSLQKVRATFAQVPRIERVLTAVQQRAFEIREDTEKQAAAYLREAEQANTLADRRRWLENAQAGFKLAYALSSGVSSPMMNQVDQMLRRQVELESLLKESETVLVQGGAEAADLDRVYNNLHIVKDVAPNDPDLRVLSRQLRDLYLEKADWKLNHLNDGSDLNQAEEYIRMADDQFFGPPSDKLNFLRRRVLQERQTRKRKTTAIMAASALIGIPILIWGYMIINSRVVQPVVAPTSTATATGTSTPMPTATNTPTATSTATATNTPTPTVTPVVLYGSVTSQVWVFDEPSPTGQRISFVLQNQQVEVIDSRNDASGQEWYKIRWTVRDSRNEGWIQANRISVTATN